MTVTTAFDRLCAGLGRHPGRPVLVTDAVTLDGGGLLRKTDAWAARLAARDLPRGSRIAVLARGHADVVALMLAIYRLGLVYVPINPRYRGAELQHVVEDCGASMLLCDQALADDRLGMLDPGLPRFGIDPGSALPSLPDAAPAVASALRDDETAILVYTSGTTGRSKGVKLSLHAIVGNIGALTELWGWTADDVLSLALPLFHVHGLCIGVHGGLLHGMCIRLHARFDPAAIVTDFAQDATIFMGVPTMYGRMLEHLQAQPPAAAVLARGRLFTAGSAALRPAVLEHWEQLTGQRILERYGMSETLITLSNPRDGERRPGAVGHPVPGCEVQVVDDAGHPVAPGEIGELWVRGPYLMQGYWNRPQDTAAAFCRGWFKTGDVVRSDPDGYLRIVGRRSVDVIKSGGFKIAAPQIEEVLRQHPSVRDAAVVGVPDARWGERIAAAVEANPGHVPTLDVLGPWVAEHLADYKKPRQMEVVDTLPRNALGKIQKPRLLPLFQRPDDPRD
ncbi:MAG: AMP-binding protein [Deltaproteobacteria bacterium]|nr:AMP-binding protein [Deltaproteobacteria bacterium]